jgi:hypothetical protein
MLHEKNSSNTPALAQEKQTQSREELGQALKAAAPRHPALDRARTKLVSSSATEVSISRYDRMHHRHSRS